MMYMNNSSIVYTHKYYGQYILSDIPGKNNLVAVKFLDTGYTYTAFKSAAKAGHVRDKSIPYKSSIYDGIIIDPDKVYKSNNYGDFKIIEKNGRNDNNCLLVKIQFIDTGFSYIVQYSNAIRGNVRDKTYKKVNRKGDINVRKNNI